MRRLTALIVMLVTLAAGSGRAGDMPIFDAHIHYSRSDWSTYTPDQALAILTDAGVRRALVSSTPDDGTLKLYERAPRMIVPFLRPYRTGADRTTWTKDVSLQSYVEERLRRGVYRGIGEVHLSADETTDPMVRRIAELASAKNLFVQAHVDAGTIERLLALYPALRLLWAHAGMSADAATVDRLLARHPKLWIELALRGDVAPGGTLEPAWRAVFLRYPNRFLVGTDTWTTSRWAMVKTGMQDIRRWLAQLPPDVAERLAYRNGDRLFPVETRPAGARGSAHE